MATYSDISTEGIIAFLNATQHPLYVEAAKRLAEPYGSPVGYFNLLSFTDNKIYQESEIVGIEDQFSPLYSSIT